MYIYSILGSKYRSVVKLWWPKDSHHIGLEFHCMVAGSECYLLCTANAVVATFFFILSAIAISRCAWATC